MRQNTHEFAQQNTSGCTEDEGNQSENHNEKRLYIQECFCGSRSTYGSAEKNNDDVHHGIRGSLLQLFNNAALTEQIAEHQHADKRSRRRQEHADNDRDDDREKDLLQFGNRTKLIHMDLPLSFRGEKFHNRRLDDRNERHVGISRYGDRSHQGRLSEFSGEEDTGRSVGTSDDGDGCGCFSIEAKSNGKEVSEVNSQLCCRTHQEGDRVGDERTEVSHRADAHENQGRQY